MIEKAALAREPHRLAFYASEIAAKFHSWYNAEKFLIEDDLPLTYARLALVVATQEVLKDVLNVMGVNSPEKM
jgi:arginyl-tRNA synthetase